MIEMATMKPLAKTVRLWLDRSDTRMIGRNSPT